MVETARLEITALGQRGEGIARHKDQVIYVPFTLANETITATIEGQRGTLVAIEKSSPDRIDPFCPHFGTCGGCQLQHMDTDAYKAFKRERLVHALARAGVDAEVGETVLAHGKGRRRATLHATGKASGFTQLRSHAIADLDHCPILVPGLKGAPEIARQLAKRAGPCDVGFTDTPMGLDVSVKAKRVQSETGLAEIANRYGLARLAINGEVLLNFRTPYVPMGPAQVPLPVGSFLQATWEAEDVLAALVLEAVGKAKAVADLFCGMGPFALRLAQHHKVYAADSDRDAITALQSATRTTSGIKAITAERRDLFRDPLTQYELDRFDCVVIDPPRAGAKAQAEALAQSKVSRVISVSCDPQSFARDAAILISGGFTMGRVTPVDQFAHSAHVEALACFDR